MFTGIVQQLGRVAAIDRHSFGARLIIDAAAWNHGLGLGESIAVNGCCLSVADHRGNGPGIAFDVIQQTLAVTTLRDLKPSDAVNLERAATLTTLFGGHIVQGHVDGLGAVVDIIRTQAEHRLWIEPADHAFMDCVVDKGSIAVNGVSLTIAAAAASSFEVALIPSTLRLTNLGMVAIGNRVNLEFDYMAKIVVSWMRRHTEKKKTPPVEGGVQGCGS